jgi:hypothetical protein
MCCAFFSGWVDFLLSYEHSRAFQAEGGLIFMKKHESLHKKILRMNHLIKLEGDCARPLTSNKTTSSWSALP